MIECRRQPSRRRTAPCRYGGGSLYRMPITAADLTEDGRHLTISGQRKQAELEAKVLGLES